MAFFVADRVKETTTSTGTGTINLAGAESGFQSFVTGVGDGNTTYYAIIDASNETWEVGVGTITDADPDTLSRDTILASSNAGSAVNFGVGEKDVFVTQPSDKAVYKDSDSDNVTIDKVQLEVQTAHPSYSEGLLWYDQIHNTLNYYGDEPDLIHEVGMEEHQKVYNNSGVTINKGEPMYFSGNFNGYPTVGKADATDVNKYNAQGLAGHDIENNSYGYLITAGLVEDIDTSGLTAGQNFFVGLTPGSVQNSSPTYPNYPMCLGWVVNSDASSGILLVNQQNHSVNSFRVRTDTHIGGDLIIDGDLTVVGSQTVASSTNVETGAPFLYLNSGDSIGEANTTFTGSGLDDAYFAGHFSGTASTTYYVKIDATGTPDTFSWSKDNFSTTEATGVAITGGDQTLDNGIKIDFGSTTGHTLNDVWSGTATPVDTDTGIWSNRNTGGTGVGYTHVGMFFDVTDSKFKLVDEYDPEPTGVINTGDSSYSAGSLVVDSIEASSASISGNITVTGTVDGRDVGADGSTLDTIETKVNGIEAGATADQTASEILTAIKTVDGTGSGLDADLLDGNQASAFATLSGSAFTGQVSVSSSTYAPLEVIRDAGAVTTGNYGSLKLNTITSGTPANGLGSYAGFFVDDVSKGSVGFENDGSFHVLTGSDAPIIQYTGANQLSLYTSGSERFRLDSTGLGTFFQNLVVESTTTPSISFDQSTVDRSRIEHNSTAQTLNFRNLQSNSGFNFYTPTDTQARLTLYGNTNRYGALMGSTGTSAERIGLLDQGSYWAYQHEAGTHHKWFITGAEKMALDSSGNLTISGTVDGRDLATDGTKLDGIESGATADQTAAEIRALVESATDSNVFTDADHTKLNGIESGATADQTASEILTAIKTVDGSGSGLDADTLDGAQPSVSASNSTIVQRHSSGYIFANYFNTTANDVSSGVTRVMVETNNDNYIRHGTQAAIRTFIGAGSGNGLDADLLDGQHGSYYATSNHNHTYDVNNAWLRDNGDNANVKLYGNSRQMAFRTDGTTEYASGIGGYPFAWTYGGDAAGNRVMLLNTSGDLWTSSNGWLSTALAGKAPSSHVHSYLPLSGGTITGDITASNNARFVGDATNALALGGLSVHGGRNDDPNKIVRTQANGYIDCGWINTTSGDRGGTVPNRIYASNDAYIRYYDLASFRSFMNVTAKTGYQGREQSSSDSNYWVGTMGWGTTTFANLFKYGSGSIDTWSSPSDQPSSEASHWVGSQHLHYSNSTSDYGHQIVVGAGNPAYMYVRGRWGTTDYGWAKMWNSSNDGSGSGLDADTVDGLHESTFMRRSANSQLDMNNNDIVGVDQIVHEGDANTYIQFHASDQFRVVTGGVERLEVNNSQVIVANDMLINGTLSVRTAIDLADNDILRFGGSDDCEMFCNGAHMLIDLNSGIGDLIIRDGTTTRFILADDGNFTATGDVTAFSDIRLKENVETIDNALDKVKSMRGVTYTKDGKNGLGVIAQEVEEVIPQVVLTADDEIGTKSVAYGNMVGLLIEAVKEQQEQIDALKNEITALKGLD